MALFKKVSDHREPPGLERAVLKKLPLYWAGGTVIPLLMVALARMLPPDGGVLEVAKQLQIIDYVALGAVMTVWTAVLTIAIGCGVVIVMKGPHYSADSYYLDGTHKTEHDEEDDS